MSEDFKKHLKYSIASAIIISVGAYYLRGVILPIKKALK